MSLEALPALRLLAHDGDRIAIDGRDLCMDLQAVGPARSDAEGPGRVRRGRVAAAQPRGWAFPASDVRASCARRMPTRYRLRMMGSTSAGAVVAYGSAQLPGLLAPLVGSAAAALQGRGQIPLDFTAVLASDDGRARVVGARATVAGLQVGPLVELLTGADCCAAIGNAGVETGRRFRLTPSSAGPRLVERKGVLVAAIAAPRTSERIRATQRAETARIARNDQPALEQALLDNRLVFEHGPYEAHVGFSNFCNMSCIMCWNGANPPLRKMSPELVEVRRAGRSLAFADHALRRQRAAGRRLGGHTPDRGSGTASISASRPTSSSSTSRSSSSCKDITETLYLSIDSHVPEVFEQIRPRSKPERVFANLPAARRARQRARARVPGERRAS